MYLGVVGVYYMLFCESICVCLCYVCVMSHTGRVKENEGESSVFYYKVNRQMKEVGEIVLSVRIRLWLFVCVCLCV